MKSNRLLPRTNPHRSEGMDGFFLLGEGRFWGGFWKKCCGTLELPGESSCLCEPFCRIIHTSRMDSAQSSTLSDSSGSFRSSTTTCFFPSHQPEFHNTPNKNGNQNHPTRLFVFIIFTHITFPPQRPAVPTMPKRKFLCAMCNGSKPSKAAPRGGRIQF